MFVAAPENWKTPFCECGGRFQKCQDCTPDQPPAHHKFTPTVSTNCTYVPKVAYSDRVSHGAVQPNVTSREACCRACYENDECVVSAWHDTAAVVHTCYLHASKKKAHKAGQVGVVECVTSRAE